MHIKNTSKKKKLRAEHASGLALLEPHRRIAVSLRCGAGRNTDVKKFFLIENTWT